MNKENITKQSILYDLKFQLNNGNIEDAKSYLRRLRSQGIYENIDEIRDIINPCIQNFIQLKFLLRRFEFNKENEENEVIDYILQNDITDEAVINIVRQNIIDKIKVLNYLSISFFYKKLDERVLIYLQEAYNLDNNNKDTVYNIAYVLSCYGEKELALEYLENIQDKNTEILELINNIKGEQ